jgi:hypothetical protein
MGNTYSFYINEQGEDALDEESLKEEKFDNKINDIFDVVPASDKNIEGYRRLLEVVQYIVDSTQKSGLSNVLSPGNATDDLLFEYYMRTAQNYMAIFNAAFKEKNIEKTCKKIARTRYDTVEDPFFVLLSQIFSDVRRNNFEKFLDPVTHFPLQPLELADAITGNVFHGEKRDRVVSLLRGAAETWPREDSVDYSEFGKLEYSYLHLFNEYYPPSGFIMAIETIPSPKNKFIVYRNRRKDTVTRAVERMVSELRAQYGARDNVGLIEILRIYFCISNAFCLEIGPKLESEHWRRDSDIIGLLRLMRDGHKVYPFVNYSAIFPYEAWCRLFAHGVQMIGFPAKFLAHFDNFTGCAATFARHDIQHSGDFKPASGLEVKKIIKKIDEEASLSTFHARECAFFMIFVEYHEKGDLLPIGDVETKRIVNNFIELWEADRVDSFPKFKENMNKSESQTFFQKLWNFMLEMIDYSEK